MIVRFDSHYHSTYSDGAASIGKIEERCLRENLGVCVTDHNEIKGSIELKERGRVPTLFGIEAGTKEGVEFLIYFRKIDEYIYFYKSQIEPYRYKRLYARLKNSAYNILECANSLDTFISLAHPFSFGKKSVLYHKKDKIFLNHVYDCIDAVEVFNGTMTEKKNYQALKLAKMLNKKITIGSDGHDLKSLAKISMELEVGDKFNYDIFFDEFINNKYKSVNKRGSVNKLKTLSVISRKHAGFFLTQDRFVDSVKSIFNGSQF